MNNLFNLVTEFPDLEFTLRFNGGEYELRILKRKDNVRAQHVLRFGRGKDSDNWGYDLFQRLVPVCQVVREEWEKEKNQVKPTAKPLNLKTIWEYPLKEYHLKIPIPKGGKILKVGTMDIGGEETPFMWVLVDPEEEKVERQIEAYFTGDPIKEGRTYIGTFQIGNLVYHVFEVIKD